MFESVTLRGSAEMSEGLAELMGIEEPRPTISIYGKNAMGTEWLLLILECSVDDCPQKVFDLLKEFTQRLKGTGDEMLANIATYELADAIRATGVEVTITEDVPPLSEDEVRHYRVQQLFKRK